MRPAACGCTLHPQVRVLLICLFLPRAELLEFKPELQLLAQQARVDDDEWVRVVGEAVGNYDGQLESGSLVQDVLAELQAGLSTAQPPTDFMPLQVGEGGRECWPARPTALRARTYARPHARARHVSQLVTHKACAPPSCVLHRSR